MSRQWIMCVALVAALAGSAALATAADRTDEKFIKEAIQGNLAEIAVGTLAQEKGQSEEARSFGAQLVKDHRAAHEKAMTLAQSMDVSAPGEPTRKQKALHTRLSKLKGDKFDRRFARAMVVDHKHDIAAFEKQAKKSGPLADFAKETLPTLRKHLEMAQSLATAKRSAR
jgi:putative membrane protein